VKLAFESFKARRQVTTFCQKCKKKIKRVVIVEHSVNSFNRNKDGSRKNSDQVRDDVNMEATLKASSLINEGIICNKCKTVDS
jgi:hypothetical protein